MSEMPKIESGARARGALSRVKWAWGERRNELALTGVRMTVALIFINSAWGKLTNPNIVASFKGTNATFAGKTSFGFYKDFLTGFVGPNADWFAYFVAYGEMFAGIALLLGLLTNAGAIAAFLLNLNFWMAASNTSASTAGINIAMGAVAMMVLLAPAAKWLSVDRWLAEHPLKGLAARHPKLTSMMIGRKVGA
jgi:thiosulfate dehydrogenase [quinone] large subunit